MEESLHLQGEAGILEEEFCLSCLELSVGTWIHSQSRGLHDDQSTQRNSALFREERGLEAILV